MAIRMPNQDATSSAGASAAVMGGWRNYCWPTSAAIKRACLGGLNQPSALSRPGNLGTAYPDCWTGNIRNTF